MLRILSKNPFKQATLVCLPALVLAISACATNNDAQSTTTQAANAGDSNVSGSNVSGTRPASDDLPDDWTDTAPPQPLDVLPPNLEDDQTVGVPHCGQDNRHIYGTEGGCLFSIEEYNNGKPLVLSCEGNTVYIDGKVANNARFGRLTVICQ